MEDIKYVVLGGNGFIGSRLRLLIPPENLIIIGRSLPPAEEEKHRYFSVQQHSLDEIAQILGRKSSFQVVDLSYNSISNTNPIYPGKDFSENLNLVIDNLYFAKKINASRFTYISSGGTVYGRTSEKLINEAHATNPVSHYGIIKLAAEKYVQMFCNQKELAYHIIRPSNVYGPGQKPFRGQGVIATALASALKKTPVTVYGQGDNVRDYIYIDDFCQWLMKLTLSGENSEIYNAGYGMGNSVLDVLSRIEKVLNGKGTLQLKYVPDRSFDVKSNVLDNRKIIQNTKINCSVGLEEGLSKTCDWIKDNFK